MNINNTNNTDSKNTNSNHTYMKTSKKTNSVVNKPYSKDDFIYRLILCKIVNRIEKNSGW